MIIYVAGYPKSGNTWFTRLIGDALNCPTGGSLPKEDEREIATERDNRWNRSCVVRKGHFVLSDDPAITAVQRAHRMNWQGIRSSEHRVVFVMRDPRDIAVSAAHHWNIPVDSTLRNMTMGTNNFRAVGPWKKYVETWMERWEKFVCTPVRYEDMLKGPETLLSLFASLNFVVNEEDTIAAYKRQSFSNRVKDIEERGHQYKLGKEFNRKFMRKGIAGDWRNHFTRELAFDAETVFGDLLRFFDYESDANWWKEIL